MRSTSKVARDRRGRGIRGPLALPGTLAPTGPPLVKSRAQQFDDLVLEAVQQLEAGVGDELEGIDFVVEHAPPVRVLGDELTAGAGAGVSTGGRSEVPLGAADKDGEDGRPRVTVYRRPVELRAVTGDEREALVRVVVIEQVAELLGRSPSDVDPDYPDEV